MVSIEDRYSTTGELMLYELLVAVSNCCPAIIDGVVRVERVGGIGGVGDPVWKYEEMINRGEDVCVPFRVLADVADTEEQVINELKCCFGSTVFGLSDSTFLFIDSPLKMIEDCVASQFSIVHRWR
jgi:hypothetical protein